MGTRQAPTGLVERHLDARWAPRLVSRWRHHGHPHLPRHEHVLLAILLDRTTTLGEVSDDGPPADFRERHLGVVGDALELLSFGARHLDLDRLVPSLRLRCHLLLPSG